jgi:uncharacterized protein YdhG (YjbR/CyaY superfamily)
MAGPETVEEYFAALPEEARAGLEELRRTIRGEAPDATERVSYRMPSFEEGGRILVWYAAFKDHYSVFPASEAVRKALGDELKPYLAGKGTIHFPINEAIPELVVRRIVEARRQETAAAIREDRSGYDAALEERPSAES